MGLLDGVLGGLVGGTLSPIINSLIQQHGGLQGIVAQLEQGGLGAAVKSWVGTGANQSVSPDEIHQAIGVDTIRELAAKVGLSPQDLASKLSTLLPQAIDKLTPDGVLPKQ